MFYQNAQKSDEWIHSKLISSELVRERAGGERKKQKREKKHS
jgi:hypothetical protein